MNKVAFGLAVCLALSACGSGVGSSSVANAPMPPECESYFKRLAQCKGPGEANSPEAAKAELEQYRRAWNPKDPQQMSVEQCKQMDATLAAGGSAC